MRIVTSLLLSLILIASGVNITAADSSSGFVVFSDARSKGNHFAPSGWMGDYDDFELKVDNDVMQHSGYSCIEVFYSAAKSNREGWAGIHWQKKPNNWGSVKDGYNLKGRNRLEVWMKGKKGGEVIEKIGIGGTKGN
ncbi:hypothetical protein ACFL96_12890, partial [Thermoproteota archaeon]